MKTVFKGEIINVVADDNGLVIAYVHEKQEDKIMVAYKNISFDNGKITNVTRNLYELTKFGTNYKDIVSIIKSHIITHSVLLENGKTFTVDPDGTAYLFDIDGGLIWKGELIYRKARPTGLAVCERHLWVAFGELNVIMRMNLTTMHEELRLGGGTAAPFINPVNLFPSKNNLLVCSKDSTEILSVNTNTYAINTYRSFDKAVKQYLKCGGYEFAILEDGIYLLD